MDVTDASRVKEHFIVAEIGSHGSTSIARTDGWEECLSFDEAMKRARACALEKAGRIFAVYTLRQVFMVDKLYQKDFFAP